MPTEGASRNDGAGYSLDPSGAKTMSAMLLAQQILNGLLDGVYEFASGEHDQGLQKTESLRIHPARAVYHGVMFHQPLVPGHDTVDVTVYDPSSDSKIVNVGSRVVVFQPNGDKLVVGEEYSLQNQSQPPKAYFNEKGDFAFDLPQGAQLGQVSSWGPSGMPVVQGTMDKGKGKYAIAYAFQPGDNGVRFSYQLPYPSNHADLRLTSDYSVSRVMLVAPPSGNFTRGVVTAIGAVLS